MIVKELIEKLNRYPSNAIVYAYEGEATGIVIIDENHDELGFIECKEELEK